MSIPDRVKCEFTGKDYDEEEHELADLDAKSMEEACGSCGYFESEDVIGRGWCELKECHVTCGDYCGCWVKSNDTKQGDAQPIT